MQKINDYAIIGNGRSAALISRKGSIDWLCWPRFDSPSLFARLIDQESGGHWKIAPVLPLKIRRYYIDETNVLKTHFLTSSGTLVLTDFMLWAAHHYRREWYIGWPTVVAIMGNKIAPGMGDWYLAKKGYDSQQYNGMIDPNKPNNLYDPVQELN